MKKITLSVALLLFGGGYFANAQVGIGTPTPASSSMLEVNATNKGVLIPNVKLTSTSEFAPIVGTEAESLMVYNTGTSSDLTAATAVTPGYYYWFASKWNRVINAADLDGATGYKEGDVIYQDGDVAGELVFKYYTNGAFVEIKFGDMVRDNETNTFIRKVDAVDGDATTVGTPAEYYYFSETDIKTWKAIAGNEDKDPTSLTDGIPNTAGTKIDVVGDVAKSFEYLLNQTTIYGGNNTTIKQIIEGLFPGTEDGNVVFRNIQVDGEPAGTMEWVFQYWDTSISAAPVYKTIKLEDIIKKYETVTTLVKDTIADPIVEDITYSYSNEDVINDTTGTLSPSVINITADMVTSITNNKKVQDVLNKFLSQGGNAYYTRAAITADASTGQLAIPADTFYTIERNGDDTADIKVAIDLSGAVINVITNNAGDIKNILGDNINNTVTKTGDTFNGGDVYIYANTTTIAANTAVTSGITIPAGTVPNTIIGIKVIDTKGISSNVTDIEITGQEIDFNIGTGNMYNILGAGDYDVIVEFVGTAVTNP